MLLQASSANNYRDKNGTRSFHKNTIREIYNSWFTLLEIFCKPFLKIFWIISFFNVGLSAKESGRFFLMSWLAQPHILSKWVPLWFVYSESCFIPCALSNGEKKPGSVSCVLLSVIYSVILNVKISQDSGKW